MLRIYPYIEGAFQHPTSADQLDPVRVCIPGCRVLADLKNAVDDARYFVDLPVGFALRSPSLLDQKTGELISQGPYSAMPENSWYADQLRHSYASKNRRIVKPIVHLNKKCERLVIVNCIDHLYGHCLLKLLNVQRHLENKDVGVCVLVQSPFVHLIPKDVAEIWEVDIPFSEGVDWYESLAEWTDSRISEYDEVFISRAYSHLSSRFWSLAQFAGVQGERPSPIQNRWPCILFSYREERRWGATGRIQERRLEKLFRELKWRFPNLAFTVIGFGKKSIVHTSEEGWIDYRTDAISPSMELELVDLMKHVDCAVGVHGSNMLLPTGLSTSSVIMMPLFKYANLAQDTLFEARSEDNREALLRCTYLYGDDNLNDICPERLAQLISNQLTFARVNEAWFRVNPFGDDVSGVNSLLESPNSLWTVRTTIHRGRLATLKEWIRQKLIHWAMIFE